MKGQKRLSFICRLMIAFALSANSVLAGQTATSSAQVAAKIDGFLESHWSANQVQPAQAADDATFLRRATLDLTGRIPTAAELDRLLAASDVKREKIVQRLMDGPEFPLHFGNVLDQMIQSRHAGNADFVDYMRRGIRDGKPWDLVFRELMLGPWDTEATKPANRFLDKRAKTTDVLAVDAARFFFGVDISCAKCHDHPLVDDWRQEHFYGMAAFFNRTTGGKGKVGEKNEGEVTFVGADGKEKTAQMMFLSGDVVDLAALDQEGAKKVRISRREQLVKAALDEKTFFSRAMVNRMWAYFFGRGLVEPVDQMHSGNESAVPGLLEWLADDFAGGGYDLRRLVKAIVGTRAYQLSSRWEHDAPIPENSLFAVASLRPLSQRQLAFSLVLATGNGTLSEPGKIQSRVERYSGVAGLQRIEQYLTIEERAAELINSLDPRRANFHSSVAEALFMSNNSASQALVAAQGDNLAARLGKIEDTGELVTQAVRTILSRSPNDDESARLTGWFGRQGDDRHTTCDQMIWALITSAEFRFNH